MSKNKWCVMFGYRPLSTKNSVFFNELNISLRQITNTYGNIIVTGDLNIYTLDITKDSSN